MSGDYKRWNAGLPVRIGIPKMTPDHVKILALWEEVKDSFPGEFGFERFITRLWRDGFLEQAEAQRSEARKEH
jgi:hypothetical protein